MAVEPEKDLPSPPPLAGEQTLTTEEEIRAAAQALLARKPEWLALCQTEDEITLLAPDMLLRRMPILRDLTGAGLYDDQIYQGAEGAVFAGSLCGAWRQGAMAASGPLPPAPACGEA